MIHYLHCPSTPEIPQTAPIDTSTIEAIVRHIMEEQSKTLSSEIKETIAEQPKWNKPNAENIQFNETTELLGEDGVASIANTMAMFRK